MIFWYIVRSQHYTKREAAQHIAKKYDDDGYLRKKE